MNPNQYRLVYVRHEYDVVSMKYGPVEDKGPEVVKTYTKWRPFDGSAIKCHEAYGVEFRCKA